MFSGVASWEPAFVPECASAQALLTAPTLLLRHSYDDPIAQPAGAPLARHARHGHTTGNHRHLTALR